MYNTNSMKFYLRVFIFLEFILEKNEIFLTVSHLKIGLSLRVKDYLYLIKREGASLKHVSILL